MEASSLLERYRRDRRHLLRFVLASGSPGDAPSTASASISDADLDRLSTDYVLDCVKSGTIPLNRCLSSSPDDDDNTKLFFSPVFLDDCFFCCAVNCDAFSELDAAVLRFQVERLTYRKPRGIVSMNLLIQ